MNVMNPLFEHVIAQAILKEGLYLLFIKKKKKKNPNSQNFPPIGNCIKKLQSTFFSGHPVLDAIKDSALCDKNVLDDTICNEEEHHIFVATCILGNRSFKVKP